MAYASPLVRIEHIVTAKWVYIQLQMITAKTLPIYVCFILFLITFQSSYDRREIKSMVHHLFRAQEIQKYENGKPWLTDDHIHGIAMDLINTCK